jgi:hypothetical protein
MLFLEFKDFLNEKKDIYLFDAEYRISYQRFINTKEIMNNIKFGGSYINNTICKNPFYLIKSINKDDLINIIDKLLINDYKTVLKKFNM